jgi:hypothetical protein
MRMPPRSRASIIRATKRGKEFRHEQKSGGKTMPIGRRATEPYATPMLNLAERRAI